MLRSTNVFGALAQFARFALGVLAAFIGLLRKKFARFLTRFRRKQNSDQSANSKSHQEEAYFGSSIIFRHGVLLSRLESSTGKSGRSNQGSYRRTLLVGNAVPTCLQLPVQGAADDDARPTGPLGNTTLGESVSTLADRELRDASEIAASSF